jgi:predicted RND superfamily exporter protein
MNSLIKYIGDKVTLLKQNELYQKYLNGNEQLLYVLVGIIIIYLLFYLLSGLYSLPLIVLVGAVLGITIQRKYDSIESQPSPSST